MRGLRFYATWNLLKYPVPISWVPAKDTRLRSETNGFITAAAVAKVSAQCSHQHHLPPGLVGTAQCHTGPGPFAGCDGKASPSYRGIWLQLPRDCCSKRHPGSWPARGRLASWIRGKHRRNRQERMGPQLILPPVPIRSGLPFLRERKRREEGTLTFLSWGQKQQLPSWDGDISGIFLT